MAAGAGAQEHAAPRAPRARRRGPRAPCDGPSARAQVCLHFEEARLRPRAGRHRAHGDRRGQEYGQAPGHLLRRQLRPVQRPHLLAGALAHRGGRDPETDDHAQAARRAQLRRAQPRRQRARLQAAQAAAAGGGDRAKRGPLRDPRAPRLSGRDYRRQRAHHHLDGEQGHDPGLPQARHEQLPGLSDLQRALPYSHPGAGGGA
mmetsp:Transcript_20026/g.46360  ORF Transcript_20026/g.46360 Transcript_20026/m.46360 type:complete len:203 (-) Transcript_20026:110-718(-)